MKIKVCGMKNPDNISELSKLPIDFMGFIFYPKSPRYIGDLDAEALDVLPKSIKRVGVFVNEDIDAVQKRIKDYSLDIVQLHGAETVEYCRTLRQDRVSVIKAFNVSEPSDFEQVNEYSNASDYFLFDTKTPQHGGSGLKFDWDILNSYKGRVPYLLSGGISLEDADEIHKIRNYGMLGLDLNSKFEIEPGLKNIELLRKFITDIKS